VEQNLKRDDVKVLAIDDINLRKGNSSTACSVFIDGETHRVLTIIQGTTEEVVKKVIKKYPSADIVSRDRGNAYSAAAKKCGKKIQVADGFHLVQNIHKAVKDALSMEVAHDFFIWEGDGWIRMVDSANDSSNHDNDDCPAEPATLESNDIEKRIHLAGINTRQAGKYRETLKVLELTERGLRTPEIAKRLSIKMADVIRYRKDATETIKKVEHRIDEYFEMKKKGKWEYHQRTIANNARSSSESIVEPYKDTVLRMLKEGKNHRNIHPIIAKEGFKGCANSVYQYIIKYCHENNIPYGRNSRVIPPEERTTDNTASRPENISIERTSRETIYGCILHEASEKKKEIKEALLDLEESPSNSKNRDNQSESGEWINKSNYADSVARIIFDTKPKQKKPQKKLSDKAFEHIKSKFGYIQHLTDFLVSFHDVFLSLDVAKLDSFIRNYKNDAIESVSTFASGLKKDYDAVRNSLLYPRISNGPTEGFNNKLKMIKRRSYGRAGIELLNAYAVLPCYYKDLDKNCKPAA
jgi:transposase